MSHLLYSSNEMYSSTDLIRKSKTIFNKILSKEIDKAIILRDGKPSFMLLDFDKYEKIMAEYAKLKAKQHTKKDTNLNEKKPQIKEVEVSTVKETNEAVPEDKIEKTSSAHIVPPTPTYEDEPDEIVIQKIEPISKEELEEKTEEEVKKGLEVLQDLDFDEEFKKEVERKVRLKKERDLAQEEQQVVKEVKVVNKNKTPLKEFWA